MSSLGFLGPEWLAFAHFFNLPSQHLPLTLSFGLFSVYQHWKIFPASGPLHLLFLPLRKLFPYVVLPMTLSYPSDIDSKVIASESFSHVVMWPLLILSQNVSLWNYLLWLVSLFLPISSNRLWIPWGQRLCWFAHCYVPRFLHGAQHRVRPQWTFAKKNTSVCW